MTWDETALSGLQAQLAHEMLGRATAFALGPEVRLVRGVVTSPQRGDVGRVVPVFVSAPCPLDPADVGHIADGGGEQALNDGDDGCPVGREKDVALLAVADEIGLAAPRQGQLADEREDVRGLPREIEVAGVLPLARKSACSGPDESAAFGR
ncbi:hypothetical protein ACQ86D_23620 [Streptomyces galilaeus]